MAKRRRSPSSDDENWSEADISTASTDSEWEDASFRVNPRNSTSKKKITTAPRTRAKLPKLDASSRSFDTGTAELDAALPAHSKSVHIILTPVPIRAALMAWFETVRDTRGMPWRKPYDPALGPEKRAQRAYEVWISEIMLQQTQVATVIPYYNRWMEKFPTIQALAAATIDQVNSLWKGLGYYSRASRLLAGAQKVVKEYDGKLPDNAKAMEANIPGIGRYSAGAICSIAYGERAPVLDGNVHRLLSRFLALHAPPKAKATLDILWNGARSMVASHIDETSRNPVVEPLPSEPESPPYPGDINQALIELGSTVCKVREPNCESCPLQTWCSAYLQHAASQPEEGKKSPLVIDIEDICQVCEPLVASQGVSSYPMKVDRKKAREELDIVHVVEWRSKSNSRDRRFLMVRRPENGLLAGLYDFPTSVNVSTAVTTEMQKSLPAQILSNLFQNGSLLSPNGRTQSATEKNLTQTEQLAISGIRAAGEVIHVFSHIRKTYRAQWVVLEGGDSPPAPLDNFQAPGKPRGRQPTKQAKGSNKTNNTITQTNGPKDVIWIPLNEILQTNMGSGVVKVWNITKKLWEKPIVDDG